MARDRQINFLVSGEQKDALEDEARRRGVSLGAVVRERVEGYPRALEDADTWRRAAMARLDAADRCEEAERELAAARERVGRAETAVMDHEEFLRGLEEVAASVIAPKRDGGGWSWDTGAYRQLLDALGVEHPFFKNTGTR